MEHWKKKPLSFSEVLDLTFKVIKEQFSRLFLIMLILIGPVDLLKVISSLFNGTALFRTSHPGNLSHFLNQIQSGQNNTNILAGTSTGGLIVLGIAVLVGIILTPVSYASILILVDKLRNNEKLDTKEIIIKAFSRYWGLLGGSMIYFLVMTAITTAAITAMIFLFAITASIIGPSIHPHAGLIIAIIVLSIFLFFGLLYLGVRWGFYFGAVTFEKTAPGIGKSWRLTKGNFWRLLGLMIVLMLITGVISGVIGSVLTLLLGQSVLASVMSNLVSLVLGLVTPVGYAVVFFDLRVRNEGEGLKQMIDEYHQDTEGGIIPTD